MFSMKIYKRKNLYQTLFEIPTLYRIYFATTYSTAGVPPNLILSLGKGLWLGGGELAGVVVLAV